jgi:hypothetical protein
MTFSLTSTEVVLLLALAAMVIWNTFLLLAMANSLTRLFDYLRNERFPEEEFLMRRDREDEMRKESESELKNLPLNQMNYADSIMHQETPPDIKIIDTGKNK